VILGAASGAQAVGSFAAIGVGSYIALAGLWAGPASGASMNPARSLGPDLVAGHWQAWWAYLAGPLAGAVIAVGIAWILRGRRAARIRGRAGHAGHRLVPGTGRGAAGTAGAAVLSVGMFWQAGGMADTLTLMAVHAHPDDESSSTGGVLAMYSDEGIRTVVVTCTNGEFGDAPGSVKPGADGHDPDEVASLRLAELRTACDILKVSDLETLGYHDSGMSDWDYKERPDVFSNIPLDVVAERIAALIRQYRPQVLVTYDDKSGYDHPDHLHAARAAVAAAEATGIPDKVYLIAYRESRWRDLARELKERGISFGDNDDEWEEPSPEADLRMRESEARITTTVDIHTVLERKGEALRTHASQIDDSWFSKIPEDIVGKMFGEETFIRAVDKTGAPTPEDDLFAGLR
jgi:LmbE family N-acetylglucosaminyl deacetylase